MNLLQKFNEGVDSVILDLAKPLMLVMFIMGSADVLFGGWLADQWWYSIVWAVVQAVTVDGLFFAVWYRVFGAKWERKTIATNFGLIIIGLVLSFVVVTTNAILSMQQVLGVQSASAAMIQLGIDPKVFNIARSILVVGVTIMVAFVGSLNKSDVAKNGARVKKSGARVVKNGAGVVNSGSPVVNNGAPANQNGSPVDQKIKVFGLLQSGVNKVSKLAKETGVPYSTLRRWKKEYDKQPIEITPHLQTQTD